jgi:hypothetical protein
MEVKGTVKLDGQPIPDGHISFLTESTGMSGGSPIKDGSYRAQIPPGKATVQITASKKMPLPPGEKGMYGDSEELRQYVPDKFNTKSELKADINAPNPALDFDLKSK